MYLAQNSPNLAIPTCGLRVAPLYGLEYALCGEHAALHGGVRPLDLGHVHEAGAAAGEAAAGERQLRDALEPALVQRAGAVPGTGLGLVTGGCVKM